MQKKWLDNNRVSRKKKIAKLLRKIQKRFSDVKYKDISVFVSSTKVDLVSERDAVNKVIKAMRFDLRAMEEFGARPDKPIDVCLSELDEADIYVCILAMRYGSVYRDKDDKKGRNGHSYTEIEYDYAWEQAQKNKNVPRILIYCIDEHHAKIRQVNVDRGLEAKKLVEFKTKVKKNHTVAHYVGCEDLIQRMACDLAREADNIISKRDEKIIRKEENDMYITLLPNSGSMYLSHPISISGTATGLQNSELYVFLAKDYPRFPLSDKMLMPMNEKGDHYITVPLSESDSWSHVLSLTHLLSPHFNVTVRYNTNYYLIVSSVQDFNINCPPIALIKPIKLRSGFVSITSIDSMQVSEHPCTIQGAAFPYVSHVFLWICSQNKIYDRIKIELNPDGSFSYTLPKGVTDKLTKGQYFGVVQVPYLNPNGDIQLVTGAEKPFLFKDGERKLWSGDVNVVMTLLRLLDNSCDLYVKFSFIVAGSR